MAGACPRFGLGRAAVEHLVVNVVHIHGAELSSGHGGGGHHMDHAWRAGVHSGHVGKSTAGFERGLFCYNTFVMRFCVCVCVPAMLWLHVHTMWWRWCSIYRPKGQSSAARKCATLQLVAGASRAAGRSMRRRSTLCGRRADMARRRTRGSSPPPPVVIRPLPSACCPPLSALCPPPSFTRLSHHSNQWTFPLPNPLTLIILGHHQRRHRHHQRH